MRRTLRGLMRSRMPSCTAWRARSALAQWVMCSPRAIGSRQASWMIRARCRGGNPGRSPGLALAMVGQQALQPRLAVAPAGPPDRSRVALQTRGDRLDRLAGRNRQDDAGPADLIPGRGVAAGDVLQEVPVVLRHGQGARFTSAHLASPLRRTGSRASIAVAPNSLHLLWPGPLAA